MKNISKKISIINTSTFFYYKNQNKNMGKKSKMSNDDPILKKNFKYEKRKKERE